MVCILAGEKERWLSLHAWLPAYFEKWTYNDAIYVRIKELGFLSLSTQIAEASDEELAAFASEFAEKR